MSEAIQMFMSARSPGSVGAGLQPGDCGTEGFAQVFEQQMQAVAPPKSAALKPGHDPARKADPEPEVPASPEPSRPETDSAGGASVDALRPSLQAALSVQASPVPPQSESPANPVLSLSGGEPDGPGGQAPDAVLNQAEAALAIGPGQSMKAPVETVRASEAVPASPPVLARPQGPEAARSPAPKASPAASAAQSAAPGQVRKEEPASGPQEDPGGNALPGRRSEASQAPLPHTSLPEAASPVAEAVQAVLAETDPGARAGLMPVSNPAALAAVASAPGSGALQAPSTVEATPSAAPAGMAGPAPGEAGETGGASAPRPSQAEMIDRLVATAKMLSTARGEKVFLLRLTPPQLGHIRVNLSVQDGVLNASVQTESHAARQSILQNLDQLKSALADQGLQLGRFDVSVEGEAGGAAQFAAGQGGGRRRRSDEEALAEEMLAGQVVGVRRPEDEEEGGAEPALSDAMAVDLLA